MSDDALTRRRALERDVAALFEATGHEVEEAVGDEPGTVVRVSRPTKGFVRPRTFWEVWLERPEPLEPALAALDAARRRHGADRALGIVVEGARREDFPVSDDRDSNAPRVIALRHLVFELTGIVDELRGRASLPTDNPAHPDQFVPRSAVTDDGETDDAVEYIEDWIQNGRDELFVVVGPERSGRRTLLRHISYRNAQHWLRDPSRVLPLVVGSPTVTSVSPSLIDPHSYVIAPYPGYPRASLPELLSSHRQFVVPAIYRGDPIPRGHKPRTLSLALPTLDAVKSWYRTWLSPRQFEPMADALAKHNAFEQFASTPAHLSRVLAVARDAAEDSSRTTDTWLAEVIVSLMEPLVPRLEKVTFLRGDQSRDEDLLSALTTGALEQFALGDSPRLGQIVYEHRIGGFDVDLIRGWLDRPPGFRKYARRSLDEAHFSNRLVRDYFLARKIASEVRAGHTEILTRYQFPHHFVLLFLAVLAPDVIAQVTADRSEELRQQIASDVEQEVQLTLSHQLRRVIGALRTNLSHIREAQPDAIATAHEYEWRRIDKELAFLGELAERTRRWHEVPNTPREKLRVADAVGREVEQLNGDYQQVAVQVVVPDDMMVSASPDLLSGALHYLLENAFQAVVMPDGPADPRVEVRAAYQGAGDTIRIDVLDNGRGVVPDDRERIFLPRVTTKKGGEGIPLGTGMGLPIAQRYAEHMGGRVGLEAEAAPTCFFLELVALVAARRTP